MYHKWNTPNNIINYDNKFNKSCVALYNTKNPNITNSNFDEYMRISDLFCTYPIFYYHIYIN